MFVSLNCPYQHVSHPDSQAATENATGKEPRGLAGKKLHTWCQHGEGGYHVSVSGGQTA